MERQICSGLKRCLYVSSQTNECQGGFKLVSSQGLVLKLTGSPEAHWPQHLHPEADMQGAYIPLPSAGFLSLANSWWCKSLAAGLAVFTSSGECEAYMRVLTVFFCVCVFLCREWQRSRTCDTKWSRFGRKCSTTTNTKSASAGPLRKGYVCCFLHQNVNCWKYVFLNFFYLFFYSLTLFNKHFFTSF